ncbi:MAG: MFS transporter, partial [Gemmatimonadaceae bacterium]
FDDKERGAAIGTWSGFSAITTAIGPVLGGWLVESVSWRAVFFINVPLALLVLVVSAKHIDESRDPSRSGRVDWTGAILGILGLSGLVLGLLEWPPLGTTHPLVVAALIVGVVSLALMLFVESRAKSPMLSLALFKSRTFSLANGLTLVLYAALSVMMFLLPLNLIQVQGYSATAAGASILPFPIIMFVLSRWSGGLVARVGSRLPLTIGPAVAAGGLLLLARPGVGASFWTSFFPAVVVLGIGMAITVAPLTTTVMSSADQSHSGAASGINNAVSRIGGLLAIAVVGVMLSSVFGSRMGDRLKAIPLSAEARANVARELPKMAGMKLDSLPGMTAAERPAVKAAVDDSFIAAFRLAMIVAAALALLAAITGFAIIDGSKSAPRRKQKS